MPFTEFYCNASTGSNMNGGSDEDTSPNYSATNGGLTGTTTRVFTPTSGDPSAVSPTLVGQFASIFLDGATAPVFIGRVTAVDATTVSVLVSAGSGTPPTNAGTGISINVGGVWKGPNSTIDFPFDFATAAMMDASVNTVRINFKNNASYLVSGSAISVTLNGPLRYEGYAATVGDGGKAVFDGSTNAITIFGISGVNLAFVNLVASSAATSGVTVGFSIGAAENLFQGCVARGARSDGFTATQRVVLIECEAHGCNTSNSAGIGGFRFSSSASLRRCISHDHTTANGNGFVLSGIAHVDDCIADTCGGNGFLINSTDMTVVTNCDSYNNAGNGIEISSGSSALFVIENCNLIKNGAYGFNKSAANSANGLITNCGFGSGTQGNTSGTVAGTLSGIFESGSIIYAADITPWVDPANGDFRINLDAAKNAGRGAFTQTAGSYAGTIGYPDIGAGQHLDAGGGGSTRGVIIGG